MTQIEWTDETWNVVTGCTKVSAGCKHCYAERLAPRLGIDFSQVTLRHDRLDKPLHWRKPRRVFVCSMADLFHEYARGEFVADVFAVMAMAHHHTFQVLTKRPERMRQLLTSEAFRRAVDERCRQQGVNELFVQRPLPNVWLGVSAENQEAADQRIPILLNTPAAKRFVSCEPLLGPLALRSGVQLDETTRIDPLTGTQMHVGAFTGTLKARGPHLDWVIVGGESGGSPERALVERCGNNPRHDWKPCDCPLCNGTGWRPKPEAREWLRSIRDQCQAAGVALFVKQLGGPTPKAGGRTLDGRTWDEFPEREAVPA